MTNSKYFLFSDRLDENKLTIPECISGNIYSENDYYESAFYEEFEECMIFKRKNSSRKNANKKQKFSKSDFNKNKAIYQKLNFRK